MADMQIISEAPIGTYQLRKELDRIRKRDDELNFRAQKTEEYLQNFESVKGAEGIFDKMMKLNIPRLKEQHVHKIIDLMPTSISELKVVLQGYTITVNNDSMKKIIDTITEFSGEKK
jgi:DNA-directed RNA polymerase subunit F